MKNYPVFLNAGINDWGGISPVTIDYVNPEAPWPHLQELYKQTMSMGFKLKPRLPIYPEFLTKNNAFLSPALTKVIIPIADNDGYIKGGIQQYVTKK